VYQRGVAKRQGDRPQGRFARTPSKHIMKLHLRELEGLFNGSVRALTQGWITGPRAGGLLTLPIRRPPPVMVADQPG
jgi:hypothetical protein